VTQCTLGPGIYDTILSSDSLLYEGNYIVVMRLGSGPCEWCFGTKTRMCGCFYAHALRCLSGGGPAHGCVQHRVALSQALPGWSLVADIWG